jgi:hypothetical protein
MKSQFKLPRSGARLHWISEYTRKGGDGGYTNKRPSSAWSLATGSLPQCSCFPHLPPKPTIIGDIEASKWIPYADDGTFVVCQVG